MSVCEVDPASVYQRAGSIFFCDEENPTFCKGWIQLLHVYLSSILCMDIRLFPVLVVDVLLII